MKYYSIKFHVGQELLPTIISLLSDRVGALAVEEVKRSVQKERRRNTGKSRMEHRAAGELIMDSLPATREEIKIALQKANYSQNTVSPTISGLMKEGSIVRDDKGVYRRPSKP